MIGKIERVNLREVWKHEAHDFTTWLQNNIDVINQVIDINLSNPEREQSTGSFNIDIVAEDDDGNTVIIENQLEKSDHDHLGKVITYLVAMEAKTAIWIVSEPRPEHIASISWLNETSPVNFYLLKIEAIKIGQSPPAALVTVIVGPSEEGKEVGKVKKEMSERNKVRKEFWTQLLELSKEKTKLHANISPSHYNWIGTSAGVRGLLFSYVIRQDESQIELYIDRGTDSNEENKVIFDKLFNNQKDIENEIGFELMWEKLESKRASRIRYILPNGGYRNNKDEWNNIHENMISTMIVFADTLSQYIKNIKF